MPASASPRSGAPSRRCRRRADRRRRCAPLSSASPARARRWRRAAERAQGERTAGPACAACENSIVSYQAEIPYGGYWSTPFARWQGAYANLNSVELAAEVARKELERRAIPPHAIDHGVLGLTVPQKHSFYGLPWFAGMAGLGGVGGQTVMQACATGVRALLSGAQEIENGLSQVSLAVTCDRTSNGPHLYYPNPRGPGGTGAHEDWVMDNFGCDPLGPHAMIRTAENVAAKHRIGTQEQHEVVLRREAQYKEALGGFHQRFMSTATRLEGDEGIRFSTPDGLAQLKPVLEGGTVTFGGQTHPA